MIRKFLAEGIPKFFYDHTIDAPFRECTFCECHLSTETKYIIEKHIKVNKGTGTTEIVYEYAICWECAMNLGGDISDDSREAVQALYTEYSDNVFRKLDYLHRTEKYTIESWLEKCTLTGKETRLCSEYAVSGIIENGNLVYEQSPMVVSDDFMEKLQSVLSKETKESFDGLRDKILDGSPSVEDLIFSPTPGLI